MHILECRPDGAEADPGIAIIAENRASLQLARYLFIASAIGATLRPVHEVPDAAQLAQHVVDQMLEPDIPVLPQSLRHHYGHLLEEKNFAANITACVAHNRLPAAAELIAESTEELVNLIEQEALDATIVTHDGNIGAIETDGSIVPALRPFHMRDIEQIWGARKSPGIVQNIRAWEHSHPDLPITHLTEEFTGHRWEPGNAIPRLDHLRAAVLLGTPSPDGYGMIRCMTIAD